ncbi:MAG: hypothetical protein KDD29_07265 [Flavobacteriales bacterium]|nr:hypothetical protein [Flavobacteriales bacterium]MCB9335297.1 hypothetical protein [Flavobacteriales bacterium]
MNFSTVKYLLLFILSAILFSCEENPLEIDVSQVKVGLKVKRFEQQLFSYEKITDTEVNDLTSNFNPFYTAFVENIINVGKADDPSNYYYLNSFIHDKNILQVQADCDSLYADFSIYEKQLIEAFKYYKYYFPNKTIPDIITYNSGFNYAIVTDSTYLGIGLEMFLGASYPAYKQLGLPQYKTRSMTNKHLTASAMLGWMATEFELEEERADLLTEMIHQGKLLYALDALMPQEEDSIKISYSEVEMEWCDKNEKQVWFFFIDNNLLYTKETKEIIKYMGEAPFIQGFPDGSPGRVGHWIGWQIVKSYMKNNEKLTVADLFNEKNAQRILDASKYKP